jgi:hypothetical protein
MPLQVYQMHFMVSFITAILFLAMIFIKSEKYISIRCICDREICFCAIYKGGYKSRSIVYTDIKDYITTEHISKPCLASSEFRYIGHMLKSDAQKYHDCQYIHVLLPLHAHALLIHMTECHKLAKDHHIKAGSRSTLTVMKKLFTEHKCDDKECSAFLTVFEMVPCKKERKKTQRNKAEGVKTSVEKTKIRNNIRERVTAHHHKKDADILQDKSEKNMENSANDLASVFPPSPLDETLSHKVITAACKRFEPQQFEEGGCAVCGQLVPLSSLSKLSAVKNFLHILNAPGMTQQERYKCSDKLHEYPYAIDHSCHQICNVCRASIRCSKVPKMALANGLWLGAVPEVLSSLRYIEKMLVAQIRHSFCSIRIASGMRKMKAHAIAYQQPIPKIYNILPPPKEDIEEVIAIMFTGPCKPTSADFKRTPFLVRQDHVKKALEWLILNHADYEDVTISSNNLNEYPEDMPPVSVEYKAMTHNKTSEGTSVHDMEDEDGTEEGDCAFTVHGLTGQQLTTMTTNAVKIKALTYLNSQGKFLAIGHGEQPESIWHNLLESPSLARASTQ